MAIILRPVGDGSELRREANDSELRLKSFVLAASRPALLIRDGFFQVDGNVDWAFLESYRPVLDRAIRSVGRLESDGGVFKFAGTAFLVDKWFAVTANFVAEVLNRQPPTPEGRPHPASCKESG